MKKIFWMGDSICMHYSPYLKEMLQGTFTVYTIDSSREALENLDIPKTGNGGDSDRVLEYIKAKETQHELSYDLFMLNCGLHDIKANPETSENQVPIRRYESNLRRIFTILQGEGNTVLWVKTTMVNDKRHNDRVREFKRYNRDVTRYNATADHVANEFGIKAIDLYTFTKHFGDSAYCDHVHFVEEVRNLQAAFLAGHLYPLS